MFGEPWLQARKCSCPESVSSQGACGRVVPIGMKGDILSMKSLVKLIVGDRVGAKGGFVDEMVLLVILRQMRRISGVDLMLKEEWVLVGGQTVYIAQRDGSSAYHCLQLTTAFLPFGGIETSLRR
jgi:hypothetical protein